MKRKLGKKAIHRSQLVLNISIANTLVQVIITTHLSSTGLAKKFLYFFPIQ